MGRAATLPVTLLLIISLISIFPSIPLSSASGHDNRITAPTIIDTGLGPGSRFNITIQVWDMGPITGETGFEDLDAWEVQLQLDPSVLSIRRVIDGPLLDDLAEAFGGVALFSFAFNTTAGTAAANELLALGPPHTDDVGFAGSGDLVYVEVEVLAYGESSITFTDTKLRDIDDSRIPQSSPINHRTVNGFFANIFPCNLPPLVSFTFTPAEPRVNDTVSFEATASSPCDRQIIEYAWDFGDGSPIVRETDPLAEHVYSEPGGSLTVTLTVTDENGGSSSAASTLFVSARTIHDAVLTELTVPSKANVGDLVLISMSVLNNGTFTEDTRLNLVIIGGGWDTNQIFFSRLAPGESASFTYPWDTRGRTVARYDVSANVFLEVGVHDQLPGNNGRSTEITLNAPQGAIPPVANFTFTPESPRVREGVTFDATSSTDPDGFITRYDWNFGDGFTLMGGPPVVFHSYEFPDTYTVRLTVTDNQGLASTATRQITVEPRPTHDVAVEQINVSPSSRLVAGQFAVLTVVVENAGTVEEDVTVRAFYDNVLIGSVMVRVFGSPFYVYYAYVNIFWDTTNVNPGDYTLSAEVEIAFDEDLSNNRLEDGTVTILPPPRFELSTESGPVGTQVTIMALGLPETPFQPGFPRPILVSFDNQFIGYTLSQGTGFQFTFNIPEAEAGLHRINILDITTLLRGSVPFVVLDLQELDVQLDVGSFYFEGDGAVATIQVLKNGRSLDPSNIRAVLIKPDGSTQTLSPRRIEGQVGMYTIEIALPARGGLGTYAINLEASYQTDYVNSEGHALKTFTVKTIWLSPGRVRTLSLIGGPLSAAAIALALVFRRNGLFKRPGKELNESQVLANPDHSQVKPSQADNSSDPQDRSSQ